MNAKRRKEDGKIIKTDTIMNLMVILVTVGVCYGILVTSLSAECEQRKMADISTRELFSTKIEFLQSDITIIKEDSKEMKNLLIGFLND